LDVSTRLESWFTADSGWVYDPATRTFDPANVRRDLAPSAAGSRWTYDVAVGPSALAARSLVTTPSVARAGKRLTVRLHVVDAGTGRTITSGVVTCAARVGSSRLRPVSSGFAARRATCVFAVPARAAGRMVRGSVAVSLAGKVVSRSFARPIR
jgi:hypothetical protein